MEMQRSPHSRENSAFDIYEQVIDLGVLIESLVQQGNLYLQQNGKGLSHQFRGNESFYWFQLHHGCKPIAQHTNILGLRSFCR